MQGILAREQGICTRLALRGGEGARPARHWAARRRPSGGGARGDNEARLGQASAHRLPAPQRSTEAIRRRRLTRRLESRRARILSRETGDAFPEHSRECALWMRVQSTGRALQPGPEAALRGLRRHDDAAGQPHRQSRPFAGKRRHSEIARRPLHRGRSDRAPHAVLKIAGGRTTRRSEQALSLRPLGCQDVIVTRHGNVDEPVLGWVSTIDIGGLSQA